MNTFSVINTNGLRFNLRAIFKGDKYGLNDCLINEEQLLIEFYDDRYKHTEHGQFVSRYYAETLLGNEYEWHERIGTDGHGLCLDGGVKDWAIDALSCEMVLRWIEWVILENDK